MQAASALTSVQNGEKPDVMVGTRNGIGALIVATTSALAIGALVGCGGHQPAAPPAVDAGTGGSAGSGIGGAAGNDASAEAGGGDASSGTGGAAGSDASVTDVVAEDGTAADRVDEGTDGALPDAADAPLADTTD